MSGLLISSRRFDVFRFPFHTKILGHGAVPAPSIEALLLLSCHHGDEPHLAFAGKKGPMTIDFYLFLKRAKKQPKQKTAGMNRGINHLRQQLWIYFSAQKNGTPRALQSQSPSPVKANLDLDGIRALHFLDKIPLR